MRVTTSEWSDASGQEPVHGTRARGGPAPGQPGDPREDPTVRRAADRLGDPASRRRFMQLVGGAGAAGVAATLLAACGGDDSPPDPEAGPASDPDEPATDLEIANYALFLEYLEEDFYAQVVESGQLRPEYETLARSIGQNEVEHAEALESLVRQLGGAPIPRPDSDFNSVINGGEQQILETAATLENLGAAAYLGQAPRIDNDFILEAALSIHTVEARHAAAINEIAGNGFRGGGPLSGSIPDGPMAEPMTREEVLKAADPYLKL